MIKFRQLIFAVLCVAVLFLPPVHDAHSQDAKQETEAEKKLVETLLHTLAGSWIIDRMPTEEANKETFKNLDSKFVDQILGMSLNLDSDGAFVQKSGNHVIVGTWSIDRVGKEKQKETSTKFRLILDPENLGDHHNMYFEVELTDKTHFKSVPANASGALFFVKTPKNKK